MPYSEVKRTIGMQAYVQVCEQSYLLLCREFFLAVADAQYSVSLQPYTRWDGQAELSWLACLSARTVICLGGLDLICFDSRRRARLNFINVFIVLR